MTITAAVLFHRFGPYHVARLEAAGQRGDVIGIEVSAVTHEYAWEVVAGAKHFRRITVSEDSGPLAPGKLNARLTTILQQCRPTVVFLCGWSGNVSLAPLQWCLKHRVPAVVMSESTAIDEPRKAWKEAIKRRLVRSFATALVGGTRHKEYMIDLGMKADRIFPGYDAVDNDHFAAGARAIRSDPSARARFGLPDQYFLASNRFIPKKNLPGLLRGFANYRKSTSRVPWDLVLLGDGPLRGEVEQLIRDLHLTGAVHLPGFKQYCDLPAYYGLASAFVHTSTTEQWGLVVNEAMAAGLPVIIANRCGCAPDLVREGINGFTFDPNDSSTLAQFMLKMSSGEVDLAAFGTASQTIIASWGPDTFAANFWRSAETAITTPALPGNFVDRVLLWMLTRQ